MSVQKNASGRWQVRVDMERGLDGKRRQRKLGTYRTKKEAEVAEREALSNMERGIDIAPASITVSDLVTRYIRDRQANGLGLKTIEEYQRQHDLYIGPHLGRVCVAKLKPATVNTWTAMLMLTGGQKGGSLGPKTVKHAYSLLSASLTWAVKLELAARNVCQAVKPPTIRKREAKALSADDVCDVTAIAEGSRWLHYIDISLGLGMRRGEAVALNWPDVDFVAGRVTINKAMSQIKGRVFVKLTKTDRARIFPHISEALRASFRAQKAQQAADKLRAGERYVSDPAKPIFTDELGNRLSPKAATNAFYRLAQKANVGTTSLHSTRHTAATELIHGGVDIVTVSRLLGHSNPNVTLGVYGHLTEGAKEEALGVLDARLTQMRRKRNAR
jgi:integrase